MKQHRLYIAKKGSEGPVKLGHTFDVNRQLNRLRKKFGKEVEIITECPVGTPREASRLLGDVESRIGKFKREDGWYDRLVLKVLIGPETKSLFTKKLNRENRV